MAGRIYLISFAFCCNRNDLHMGNHPTLYLWYTAQSLYIHYRSKLFVTYGHHIIFNMLKVDIVFGYATYGDLCYRWHVFHVCCTIKKIKWNCKTLIVNECKTNRILHSSHPLYLNSFKIQVLKLYLLFSLLQPTWRKCNR